ncbi:transcription elongation factor spt5 [Peltigera leucophlebia]|nr:transcription elongation factor spt5 [Peltigera leucophlebia]
MAALFNIRPTRQLEPGTFVCPNGGLYKGHWAQIDEIDGKDGSASIDISAVLTAKDTTSRTGGHLIGEDLEAFEDDQKGIRGKVLVSRNGMVILRITESEEIAGQNIDIAAKSLRRAFSIGDRIKVVGGCHSDEVGMIVSVKTDTVVFMSENHEQLTVFRNDVRVSDDAGVPGGI